MASYAERLAKVQTVIDAIMDGGGVQNYSIDGQTFSLVDLDKLRAMEKEYAVLAREESGGGRFVFARLRPR
jgi:hypothetical protein